ncbi:hypothetical protein AYI70_g12273 [Smittium culicis]|uniref:Uncharacterized protein n=1 Tax=Smittium culicis TaxID=133412 RepID=A0A1R1WY58_9FUNG|nr:hypothetical protein AYI70_g12273 [Smittium culicis]
MDRRPHQGTDKARMATWVTGSARWIKKLCSQDSNGQTIITIVDRKIVKKGNWVDLQAVYPDLKLGLYDIGKMRMGTFRTAQRLSTMKILEQKLLINFPCFILWLP